MNKTYFIRFVIFGSIVAVSFFLFDFFTKDIAPQPSHSSSTPVAEVKEGSTTGQALIGGTFQLVDQDGQVRTDQDFRGKYMMVYFGYSFCPDICPAALNNMTAALNQMPSTLRQKVTPIFISVDPERDSPEHLNSYMENFHDKIVALTGTKEQVEAAVKAYHVYSRPVTPKGTDAPYLIDHSSIVYLMDRQGHYVTSFNHETEPKHIVKILTESIR